MRNQYWLLILLVIGVFVICNRCNRENMTDQQYNWSGSYVYNKSGGTLSIQMKDPQSFLEDLGTITLKNKSDTASVWIIKGIVHDNQLYGSNSCSNILLTKGSDSKTMNVKLSDLNNQMVDLEQYLGDNGCSHMSMDTWITTSKNELYKGSVPYNKWYKIQDGYNFVQVTDDYIFALKPAEHIITPSNTGFIHNRAKVYYELDGEKYYVSSCNECTGIIKACKAPVKVLNEYADALPNGPQPFECWMAHRGFIWNKGAVYYQNHKTIHHVSSCTGCHRVSPCNIYNKVSDNYIKNLTKARRLFHCDMVDIKDTNQNYTVRTIQEGNSILKCKRPCNTDSKWESVEGELTNMDVNKYGWVGVNKSGNTYVANSTNSPSFKQAHINKSRSSASNDTYLYVIADDYSIYMSPRINENWKRMDLNATVLTVDNNSYWLIGAIGKYKGKLLSGSINPSTGTFDSPAVASSPSFKYITMDSQYVYGINNADEVYTCPRPLSGAPGCHTSVNKMAFEAKASQISSIL